MAVRALWAPVEAGFGAELVADLRHTNRPARTVFAVRVSNFADARFHGFGNDTPEDPSGDAFEVEQRQLRAHLAWFFRDTPRLRLYAGPVLKWTGPGTVTAL